MTDAQATPFAVLTLIAAPAILTNACSVLALGTSNRLARAVDAAQRLMTELEQRKSTDPATLHAKPEEMDAIQRRIVMLITALSHFYVAIGGFAMTALISLIGAAIVTHVPAIVEGAIETAAIAAGILAVAALVRGTLILVRETRVAMHTLDVRMQRVRLRFAAVESIRADDASTVL